jgi:Predicted membrane-associated Zn-dependent proteases 1
MSTIANTALTILEFILAFGVLIFLHEFGHFIVARLSHIEVEEFGFGYPPRIAKVFRFAGTDFTLNWIPFGGFCRMKGEAGDIQEAGSFSAATPWQRLFTLLGGPVMNLLLGTILIVIIIMRVGVADTSRVSIASVDANSPAATAHLQVGDIIEKINGSPVTGMDSLSTLVKANLGKETDLTVKRGSDTFDVNLVPRVNPPEGRGAMGIAITNPTVPTTLIQAVPAAFLSTVNQGVQLIMVPVRLISGQIAPSSARMVSVVGIYSMFDQVKTADAEQAQAVPADAGLNILSFVAMLSIALGYTNLLPIPALDGGHILFILPELFFHKRVRPELENRVHMIGYSLLMILMVVLIINDILNPIVIH